MRPSDWWPLADAIWRLSEMANGSRLIRWALRAYPRRWQSRHLEEALEDVRELSQSGRNASEIVSSLLWGAIYLRLAAVRRVLGIRVITFATVTLGVAVLQGPTAIGYWADSFNLGGHGAPGPQTYVTICPQPDSKSITIFSSSTKATELSCHTMLSTQLTTFLHAKHDKWSS